MDVGFKEEATVNSDDVGFHGVNAGIGGTDLAFGFGEANLHALIQAFEVNLEIVDVVVNLLLAGTLLISGIVSSPPTPPSHAAWPWFPGESGVRQTWRWLLRGG